MSQNQSPPRPATQAPSIRAIQAKNTQIEVALSVIDNFADMRQMVMCPEAEGVGDLTPKEEAAYNAALDRLERYLDEEFLE